jgi:hypothetical protein
MRIGVVRFNCKSGDLSKAEVWRRIVWRHADHDVGREDVVRELIKRLRALMKRAEAKGLRLAPVIGVACPGLIAKDGSIGSGGQVMPGDWRSPDFNLPARLRDQIPLVGGQRTVVLLHNDAVVQGLSEIPFLDGARRWGIFTVGTGLGNARFSLMPERRSGG